MKLLEIDYEYYAFPDGIGDIEEFVKYVQDSPNMFIKLTQYDCENCTPPYFIDEDKKTVYLNVRNINRMAQTKGTVLSREEYERRLDEIVEEKCVHCMGYRDEDGEVLCDPRGILTLDGECEAFETIED